MNNSRDPAKEFDAAGDRASAQQALLRRLAFLGLTQSDAQRLRTLVPHFEAVADDFVEAFYGHLFAFPETARFLQDPARVERLKRAQRLHFESLLAAEWDEEFAEQRRRAGQTHAELELSPELFLGAYNQYAQHCFRYFAQANSPQAEGPLNHELDWLLSLVKVMFLDIGLTLDAYFTHSTQTLQQALDLFWKANQDLRRFAQLASHDLKTPLATVANRCEEALDEFGQEMPAEARELISQARDGVFRMSRLIDELLASTIAPETDESSGLFDSQTAFAEAIERLQPLLDKKRIALQLPAAFPQVWGNRVQLREAFYNLLSNAAKFIRREPGVISIAAQSVGDDECLFSITDNGPGIPPEELERIFVPFRRLPMHRVEPGSGLGLYFTKSLVEAQGGKVWAESELGQGSSFHVRLRARQPSRSGRHS